jgi:hypothetical protein
VEPHAKTESAPQASGKAATLWRLGADVGSFHAWFEERGPRGCLMNMVDDATTTACSRLGE